MNVNEYALFRLRAFGAALEMIVRQSLGNINLGFNKERNEMFGIEDIVKASCRLHKMCKRSNISVTMGDNFIEFSSQVKEDIDRLIRDMKDMGYKEYNKQYGHGFVSISFKRDNK